MNRLYAKGALALLLTLTPLQVRADPAHIQAVLDRNVIGINESATLQITIEGGGEGASVPELPSVAGFSIRSTGRMENTTIDNGVVSNSLTLQYSLTPTRSGSFTVGPISAEIGGQNVSTQALQLQVTGAATSPQAQANGPAPAGLSAQGPAFLTAEVDDKSPYVGQLITYKLRFYHLPGVVLAGKAQYPQTTGFITHPAGPEKTSTTEIEGRTYQVNEVSLTLIPTGPGDIEVGSSRLLCQLPSMGGDEDLLGLLGGAPEKELVSQPIPLNVRPVPLAGRPADYTGGVGNLRLEAKMDTAGARVGQPLNLELTLRGQGNLELVQSPPLPPMAGFKAFDAVAGAVTAGDQGSREFSVVLVPTRAGSLEVPAISMASFDPATGKYVTVNTGPIALEVGPAAAPTAPAPVDEHGLRPIHLDSPLSTCPPLSNSAFYWLIQGLPLAVIGCLGLVRLVRRAPLLWQRRGSALRLATSQLASECDLVPIIHRYLSDKLGQSTAAMSSPQLADHLLARGASPGLVERLLNTLAQAERARYSGLPSVPQKTGNVGVVSLFKELERCLR